MPQEPEKRRSLWGMLRHTLATGVLGVGLLYGYFASGSAVAQLLGALIIVLAYYGFERLMEERFNDPPPVGSEQVFVEKELLDRTLRGPEDLPKTSPPWATAADRTQEPPPSLEELVEENLTPGSGGRRCPRCHGATTEGAVFCISCGAPLPREKEEKVL